MFEEYRCRYVFKTHFNIVSVAYSQQKSHKNVLLGPFVSNKLYIDGRALEISGLGLKGKTKLSLQMSEVTILLCLK